MPDEPDRLRALVVDQDPTIRAPVEEVLTSRGWEVASTESGEEGIYAHREKGFDAVVLDNELPGMSGLEVLRQLRAEADAPEIIVVTADPNVDDAVEAMRLGAFDYRAKPLEAESILRLVARAADRHQARVQNRILARARGTQQFIGTVVADSPQMEAVLATAERIGPTDAPVLITGETGTGKGLMAKKIHSSSGRRDASFVHLNCGGLQEQLVESELFGHEKGAFTGAIGTTPGLFEVGHRGTIFLDEITELGPKMQSKLLQVLDTGEVRRVGGSTLRDVDTRVLAATNEDIERRVEGGRFRKDLFFRLNVVRLEIPPLRQRRQDIAGLSRLYVRRYGGEEMRISAEAEAYLAGYDWPGNVRELANIIQRAVLLSTNRTLEPADLPLGSSLGGPAATSPNGGQPATLRENERMHIKRVLELTGGVRAQAARLLGIDIKTLRRKIRAYGLGS